MYGARTTQHKVRKRKKKFKRGMVNRERENKKNYNIFTCTFT